MASTAQKREWWADWECATDRMVRVAFPGDGLVWNLLVADITAPFWEQVAALMAEHGYLFRESAGGTYNCRNIGGTDKKSMHAYGLALDLNPSKNQYGGTDTDMPQAFVDDILAIKTISGVKAFRWGMVFDDPMHWEIDAHPDDIRTGVDVTYRGVLNVPDTDWARRVVDWGIDTGVIVTGDDHPDDWNDDALTMGRIWTLLYRNQ